MRQLRRHVDAAVEERRHRPLPLQCLRSLLQDERPEPTAHQTQTETGELFDDAHDSPLQRWTLFLSWFGRSTAMAATKRIEKGLHEVVPRWLRTPTTAPLRIADVRSRLGLGVRRRFVAMLIGRRRIHRWRWTLSTVIHGSQRALQCDDRAGDCWLAIRGGKDRAESTRSAEETWARRRRRRRRGSHQGAIFHDRRPHQPEIAIHVPVVVVDTVRPRSDRGSMASNITAMIFQGAGTRCLTGYRGGGES